MGSGRTELLMHLFGAWGHRISGAVEFAGRAVSGLSPQGAVARGLVLVSEDRKRYGLVLDQDLGFNLTLSSLARLSNAGLLDQGRLDAESMELFRSLKVKAPALSARAGGLSGGNQQKIVIGKALMTKPQVIFLDEPTRGIDVGAKLEVYEIINRLTADGKAVVLVSSELPELMGMSDRIIMLHEGAVGGRFNAVGVDQEALISAAMGQIPKNS
jgi:D-xylose transport system ATP-binding protein